MGEYVDIHKYKARIAAAERSLQLVIDGRANETSWKNLSQRNAKLIFDFERTCSLVESARIPTRIKYIDKLSTFCRFYLRIDLDGATRDDIKRAISEIDHDEKDGKPKYTANTRETMRACVKKIYRWLAYGDDFNTPENRRKQPPVVSWLNTQLNKHEYPKVKASALMTEDEVILIINAADNPRDRAYVAMLYELGSRVGEHGGLRLKHVTKTEHGYVIDLFGKTLDRTPALILAAPYLTAWLNVHPDRGNPDAPLWPKRLNDGKVEPAYYDALRLIIIRLAKRARIEKRIYNHIFRHSRVTHVLVHNIMTEAQCKLYFGWTPDSKMLAEYSHLRMIDVNKNYLATYGLVKEEDNRNKLMPKICPRCKHINPIEAITCEECNALLDVRAVHEVHDTRTAYDQMMEVVLNYPAVAQAIRENQSELNRLISQHEASKKAQEATATCASSSGSSGGGVIPGGTFPG